MKNLSALRIYCAVVQTGSLSAAARSLDMATASVFNTIRELEKEFEAALLLRSGRKLLPTVVGEALLLRAQVILGDVARLQATAREMNSGMGGMLNVHTRIAAGSQFIVPVLAMFRRAYPEVRFRLILSDDKINLSNLDIDLFILDELPGVTSLVSRKLVSARRMVCASPKYLRRRGTPKLPSDLHEHECITAVPSRGQQTWRFREGGGVHTVHPPAVMQTTDWHAMVKLALEGNGLIMMPAWSALAELQSGRLVQVLKAYDCCPAASGEFRENLWVLYPRARHKPPKVRAFLDMLVAFIDNHLPAPR